MKRGARLRSHKKSRAPWHMGLLVPTYVMDRTGATFPCAYLSIMADMGRFGRLNVERSGDGSYLLRTNVHVFASQAARVAFKGEVDNMFVEIQLTAADLASDLFALVYSRVRESFPDAVDC